MRTIHVAGIVLAVSAGVGLTGIAAVGDASVHTPPYEPASLTINGVTFTIVKSRVGVVERRSYWLDGVEYDEPGARDLVAARPASLLTPAVQSALDAAAPDDLLDLVVVLRVQPGAPISRQVKAGIAGRVAELGRRMQDAMRPVLRRPSMPPEQERQLAPPGPDQAQRQARAAAARELDDLRRDAMRETFARLSAAIAPSQAELAAAAQRLGAELVARVTSMNALVLRVPSRSVAALAAHPLVASIDVDHPGEPELDNQSQSLGLVTGFWQAAVTGGVQDCGVLDTGVQQNHPSLSAHPFISNMGTADTSTHGTRVAGIMASTHQTYRGMAFGLDTIVMSRAGSISTSMPGMDFIASTGEPENTNYSFSNGTASDGDYTATDRFFDAVIDTFGFMVSKSTGNGGYSTSNLTITHPAPAFNLLASANMDDKNTVTRDDDRITSSSSVGPTLGGRKKPDITAPGHNSMSTTPSGGFANIGGTSAASPHTGGGVVLLMDVGLTDVMAAKAVLLNTTDAITDSGTSTTTDDQFVAGSLWNRRYGWGYLNLGAAYLHGLDVFVDEVPASPEQHDHRFYVGPMFDKERATLVWQRHVAYSGAMFPAQFDALSDLDLLAYRESDGQLVASSTSTIDNVEQLHVNGEGVIVLKVDAFGPFDPDVAVEGFALATQENFAPAGGPALQIELVQPTAAVPDRATVVEAHISNSGDLAAHQVAATLSGLEIVGGANPAIISTLPVGATAVAAWTVLAPAQPGDGAIVVSLTSNSYGETFAAQATAVLGIGRCTGDFDASGAVNGLDLAVLLGLWTGSGGYSPCPPVAPQDLNQDCTINGLDIAILLGAWGPCP